MQLFVYVSLMYSVLLSKSNLNNYVQLAPQVALSLFLVRFSERNFSKLITLWPSVGIVCLPLQNYAVFTMCMSLF